jgi:hypothetical protein
MSIGSHGHARAAPHVFAREFDGELVLLDVARGDYFGLDAVGARLWEGLTKGRTPHEVAEEITHDYAVDLVQSVADLTRLADELVERGLLIPA